MVMKSDRHLDQPLQELLFRLGRPPPHVFQNFVRIEELTLIEELQSAPVSDLIHNRKA